jgi:hypothetical protein
MTTIKQIMRDFGPQYIQRFGQTMPDQHRRAIDAIARCRTDFFGAIVYRCQSCAKNHLVYRCCGNRHCPSCQSHKTRKWLENRLDGMLPVHHFMITFTVPDSIRSFIRSNQRLAYAAMFAASSQTLKKLAKDKKFIGADLSGFFGVLHTWGRTLSYHPHIHYIVPGGALSKADQRWHPSRKDFFLPVRAMSKIFKAKFFNEMKKAGLASKICPDVWRQAWVVNCQAVGTGANSVKYLAPYVFKVAISNKRIVNLDDGKVFFRYKKSGSNRWRTMALQVMEFIRRFCQHVLPSGFMKVRYYGFMNPASSIAMDKIAKCIALSFAVVKSAKIELPSRIWPKCTECGGRLIYYASIVPYCLPASGTR